MPQKNQRISPEAAPALQKTSASTANTACSAPSKIAFALMSPVKFISQINTRLIVALHILNVHILDVE